MARKLETLNPARRFQRFHVEYEPGEVPEQDLELYEDTSRSILSENDSPDLGFRFGVNPYRGCQHSCGYCYARPTHEYLGFGAGTDFDRKITVKRRAAELLRAAFERPSWQGEILLFSGNTDCYQPIERKLEVTRACLAVCTEYRNPVHVITKSALVERDFDLIARLAREASAGLTISLPFLDEAVARALEPYAPTPERRLETVRRAALAGIQVSVNVAPLIPGLNDHNLVALLEAARAAGATGAGMSMLRLPGPVKEVFVERLERLLPEQAGKVLARVREMRGGKLNDPRFGVRLRGEGRYADTVASLFELTKKRLGLDGRGWGAPAASSFRRPERPGEQLSLFASAPPK